MADTSETKPSGSWFEEWFNHPLYLAVYSHRDKDEAVRCIHTILSLSGLDLINPDLVSVLDIACGAGRHALELARLGYRVTGNDLSPFLLEEARKEAARNLLQIELTCCDMRHIPAGGNYDLVVQLFTSFGYFDSKEEDRQVLGKVYNTLGSGGWYVLDLINPLHLARTLLSESCKSSGELSIHEKRKLEGERISKTITITSPSKEQLTFQESVRLYSKSEIVRVLQGEGFRVETIIGNYDGDPFEENESPRMILFCRKP
ncbi:MAG: class I SAM-dependent methyltransferase [Chlorobium sp.]|nr:MAG: class I SAM-dependent methyltransferase [Chlorobium sp.]